MVNTKHYTFLQSRNGKIVPAFILPSGKTQPLHSMVDPVREAERLVLTIPDGTGFVIFLGLGGGFAAKAVLERTGAQVVVIDFNADAVKEIFSSMDLSKLLRNDRFSILIDPYESDLKNLILEQYKPVLCGGIKVIPLRTRIETDRSKFENAASILQEAIENTKADYSVQAHFGKRWFSNIIRNLITAEEKCQTFLEKNKTKTFREAAIVAAGPSLDHQINILDEYKSRRVFIICCDTALPVLGHHGIKPDAIVSIDCQHISYYHFMGFNLRRDFYDTPLFLDIASPPLLCSFSSLPVFFSSGHPLAFYIAKHWLVLPLLDTSGGNVTHACLSLAEIIGAQHITLFGTDFSYIGSRTYARGTYIQPFFEKKQSRLSPLETHFSAFLYRSVFLSPQSLPNSNDGEGAAAILRQKQNYYETSQLRFYRKKLEEKAAVMPSRITTAEGMGAPIDLRKTGNCSIPHLREGIIFPQKAGIRVEKFLQQYRKDIAAIPVMNDSSSSGNIYLNDLSAEKREVFITLLPLAAALKKHNPLLKTKDLIEEVKCYCIREIGKVLNS